MTNIRALLSTGVIATALLMGGATPALAELTANAGFASEYYFRGVLQKESAGSAGLDFKQGGLYVGTWAVDVGDGLEVDVYGGYGWEFDGGFSLSVGATGYYYTGDTFDDTYEEINLSAGWGPVSLGYSIGEHDTLSGSTEDYDFIELTVSHNGFYGTVGAFGDDLDGEYIELGYGTNIGGFDAGIAAIFNTDELSDQCDSAGKNASGSCIGSAENGEALIFTLSKTFDIK